jgi:hypothetical protein
VKEFQASRGPRGLEISDGPSDNFGSPVALLRAEFYTPKKIIEHRSGGVGERDESAG